MNLRLATKDDLERMYQISDAAHLEGYGAMIPKEHQKDFIERFSTKEEHRQKFYKRAVDRIESPQWRVWIAEIDGFVVGYTYTEIINENYVYKRGMFVDPTYQGYGIGKALFEKSLTVIEKGIVHLTVIKANEKARSIYFAHRFVDTDIPVEPFFGAEQVVMEYRKV